MKKLLAAVLIAVVHRLAPGASDRELVAAVLVGEAGGEGLDGMKAVHEVISNRAKARRLTEAQVVRQPWQFSCLNRARTRRGELSVISRAKRHPQWKNALNEALAPANTCLTKGSDHYLAPARLKRLPGWAAGRRPDAVVGRHWFYKISTKTKTNSEKGKP